MTIADIEAGIVLAGFFYSIVWFVTWNQERTEDKLNSIRRKANGRSSKTGNETD
jgi:hypothetical protein